MPQISVSEYWNNFLKSIVESGIRHSKAQVVSEALATVGSERRCMKVRYSSTRLQGSPTQLVRHRRALDSEMEEALQVKAEIKERREARGS